MPRIFSATYTPYTYEELAAPVREATAAHQAVELNFDALMTDADKMRAFLNEDWLSYKDYKEYVDQLNAAAYDLARNGLTRQNRGNLLQLKRDYNGKIQAINAGILSRQNAIETFNKSAKGQSSRYIGPRPEDYSVDEYMYGNNPFKLGVEGSEIYSYADEQAKASTSRRYQEFTEGGKWRITEVGVDPNTTSMVMDALRTGKNFTDPEYALLALNNPRQFLYMQAVLDDMRSIADDTRQTFGYGQFSEFDDNGNPVWSQNQKKFDAEIYGGLNKGIQYARKSEADPYLEKLFSHNLKMQEKAADFQYDMLKAYISQGLKDGTLAFDDKGNIVQGQPKQEPYSGFGFIQNEFTNPDAIKATKPLKLQRDGNITNGLPIKIKYNGKEIQFNDRLDAYNWAHQDNNSNDLKKIENDLCIKYSNDSYGGPTSIEKVVSRLEDALKNKPSRLTNESKQYYDIIKHDLDIANKIVEHNKEYNNRSKVLKQNDYYLSENEYDRIVNEFGFDRNGNNLTLGQVLDRIDESTGYANAVLNNRILLSPAGKTSISSEGKVTYKSDPILEKQKYIAMSSLADKGKNIEPYIVDEKDNAQTKKMKKDDALKIINNAVVSYTTTELALADNGRKGNDFSYTPIMVFMDSEGNKVGLSMEKIIPSIRNTYNSIRYVTTNHLTGENIQGIFTDPNKRNIMDRNLSNIYSKVMTEEFGD